MHGTGRRRAGACARFRRRCAEGQRRRAKTPREPGTRQGAEPENGGGYAELSLRSSGAHANVESQCPETERKAATGEFRTALRSDWERSASSEEGARPRRLKNAQHAPRALPARSGQPQRGRVLREKEEAWSFREEPMGSGVLSGGGAHDQSADWPSRPPVCRCGGSHVPGAGSTSCWRPTRGGAGGASAASGWSGGRGVLVS